MRQRGRPRKPDKMESLAVRLPDELVQEIDDYVERIKSEFPLINVSRGDAIRQLLAAGIEAEKIRLAKWKER